MTRRSVLSAAGSVAVSLAAGPRSMAGRAIGLYHIAAERAAALARGRTVSLRLLMPSGSGANISPVISMFRDMTGIDIVPVEVPVDEINTQLTLDALSGEGDYDLALPATFGIPDLASSGAIRPLSAYAARYEPPDFRSESLYAIGDTLDGEIYGFQTDGDAYLMFYHADWVNDADAGAAYADKYGVALAVPETWQELDRQMAFFHEPDKNRFGGALFRTPGYLAWEWWIRFHAKGVWPLALDLQPQIASDEGVAALEELIRATDSLYPQARSAGLFENWELFGKGNIFCNIGWGGTQKYLNGPKSALRGKLVHAAPPSGLINGRRLSMPYFNWGWNYVVTEISREPEIAYLFALFASTSEISTRAVREAGGYFDPFRPEHYNDPKIVEIYTSSFLDVHKASMQEAIPDLYLANQGEYFRVLSEALDAAVNGGEKPEIALGRASTQWSLINRRSGLEKQIGRWKTLRGKYPEAARSVLRDLS